MAAEIGFELRRREASFRGVALAILSSTRSGGRRLDVHTFGKRERPFAEDMGREPRTFSVRGVVVGDDHDLAAVELEEAFELEGPGELVLPHRAPISCAVRSYRFEEPDRSTGVQNFEVEFVEAGIASYPGLRTNTSGQAIEAVATAVASSSSRFAAVFDYAAETVAGATRIVASAGETATELARAFRALMVANPVTEEIALASQRVDELKTGLGAGLGTATVAAEQFSSEVDNLLTLFSPEAVYLELAELVNFGADYADLGSDSLARTRSKTNRDAWVRLVREVSVSTRSKALAKMTFSSSTDAAAFRDEIAAELDQVITAASDAFSDTVAADLRTLRTLTIIDLDTRAARLPARVSHVVAAQTPALVLSQRFYGTPSRDLEIVSRNDSTIRNPGRVPAGSELEVLRVG